MNTISNAYAAMVDAIILDPTISRNDAGVVIEGFGPTMAGTEARNWIDAVATFYNSLGILNNPTWASLRSGIVADGAAPSKLLFDALISGINSLPETFEVNNVIQIEARAVAKASIPANIALLTGFKTGDEQLDTALDQGIQYLTALDDSL